MADPTLIERLARHLAAGDPQGWHPRIEDAASIVALLKEPDDAMRAAGDVVLWQAMIDAALHERWSLDAALGQPASVPHEAGADEEGEIRLDQGTVDPTDQAGWVQLKPSEETPA